MKIKNILLLIASSFLLCGCSTPSVPSGNGSSGSVNHDCEHNFKATNKVDPTLTSKGSQTFTCDSCSKSYSIEIPALYSDEYEVSSYPATCKNPAYDLYSSSLYGEYRVETGPKLYHSTNMGKCSTCDAILNQFVFNQTNTTVIHNGGGYPRLYELDDGTWLCGFDTGAIQVVRSEDQGESWTDVPVVASVHSNYACANVAFHQLDNGDILCAYRAIGQSSDPYGRYIHCTISKDNGYTWSYHSTIANGYELGYSEAIVNSAVSSEGRLGFFEPHFGIVNGEVTVMYADDLTPMLENVRGNQTHNYETQYLISKTLDLNTNTWSNPNIVMDGTKQKTVSGVTEYSRDGMPVFDKLSDGTYVLVFEGTYRRTTANGNHPFIILLSYSTDGIHWENPVEIYVPTGEGTKASAPYVCVTDDDRLIVSFQTDESCYAYNKAVGDNVSVMKTIISDGTPIDQITAANFYPAQKNFETKDGYNASWNGMMVKDDYLYSVTGTSYPSSSIRMNKAKIPENYYGNYSNTTSLDGVTVRNGGVNKLENGWYQTTSANTLATFDDVEIYDGEIAVDFIPHVACDAGITFRGTSGADTYWEEYNASYYCLIINSSGNVMLFKIDSSLNPYFSIVAEKEISDYNPKKMYNLKVELWDDSFAVYVNNNYLYSISVNSPLDGVEVGFRSASANTLFSPVTAI